MYNQRHPSPAQLAILARYTRADLLAVMLRNPHLAAYGYWVGLDYPAHERGQGYRHERERLANELMMFQLCCAWLAYGQPTKQVNRLIGSSYGLKHRVESHFRFYITNGSLIAAALHLGLPVQRSGVSRNAYIGLAKRSLPRAADQIWTAYGLSA